jgi:hypothetical protein
MTTPLNNQGSSTPASTLVPLQVNATIPQSTALASATNMLVADSSIESHLQNFPEEAYDLRPTSHLVRIMQVLLGESGVGQLRKRLALAQWAASSVQGARFFDLDRFYGALFGARRTPAEELPVNAMDTATATLDEWEQMEASDASYRDRMVALARSLPMAGTKPGLQAAAEAVLGAPVEIFESWALLEAAGAGDIGHSWDYLEAAFANWTAIDGQLWSSLEGAQFSGRSGVQTRSEVLVRIRKEYPQTPQGRQDRQDDAWAVSRVLERLKPANVLLTVDAQGVTVQKELAVAAADADSENWQVVQQVTPDASLPQWAVYPLSAGQQAAGVDPSGARIMPLPPLTTQVGDAWTHEAPSQSARSYTYAPLDVADGDWTHPGGIPDMASTTSADQVVVWRDGSTDTYRAARGLLDAAQALSAKASSDGALVAHPYSGDRRTVPTAD